MIATSSKRDRHRPILGVGVLAVITLAFAACAGTAGSSPSPSDSAGTGTTPTVAAPSTTATVATPTVATPTVATPTVATPTVATPTSTASPAIGPCLAADTVATAGPLGGAAGSRGADVVVRTSSGASCRLPASPEVAIVDAAGTVLRRSLPSMPTGGPSISATSSVSFSLQLSNWCDPSTTMPLHFRLALADSSLDIGGLTMAVDDLPPCNGPGRPASLSTTEWMHP